MGPVSATNSNLSKLLQTLSGESPELSSLLSSPSMQSALEKASPGDLVQLSDQAMQLQQVGLLFGNTDSTQAGGFSQTPDSLFSILGPANSNASPDPLMQALESSLGLPGSNNPASTATTANPLAGQPSGFQAQELDALFGATQTADPFLNTLG